MEIAATVIPVTAFLVTSTVFLIVGLLARRKNRTSAAESPGLWIAAVVFLALAVLGYGMTLFVLVLT
ncbi:hypothetical protein [Nesterenkonia sandarakina]|uniref:Uncharacterized protein n=1 Tax=Nesterenkonia sandarakina TaxID=272918 RepID=A0A2T0YA39_9MICC|nr:hypothetical protein [Nesterenkonia sandarakina]PRZ11412.1 hypothetical protein BCL67_1522 [Nesterenkonia sandarakina]